MICIAYMQGKYKKIYILSHIYYLIYLKLRTAYKGVNHLGEHKHIVPHESGWALKKENSERASKVFETKKEALAYAKDHAEKNKVCIYIHGKDGKIDTVSCKKESISNVENQHVVPYEKGWAVRSENSKRVTKTFEKKDEAIDYARSIADNNGVYVIIHTSNGRIQRYQKGILKEISVKNDLPEITAQIKEKIESIKEKIMEKKEADDYLSYRYARPDIHVKYDEQGFWTVNTTERSIKDIFQTKGLAVAHAYYLAQNQARVIVHKRDGLTVVSSPATQTESRKYKVMDNIQARKYGLKL
jgi:uncharacterized protein YdaT